MLIFLLYIIMDSWLFRNSVWFNQLQQSLSLIVQIEAPLGITTLVFFWHNPIDLHYFLSISTTNCPRLIPYPTPDLDSAISPGYPRKMGIEIIIVKFTHWLHSLGPFFPAHFSWQNWETFFFLKPGFVLMFLIQF